MSDAKQQELQDVRRKIATYKDLLEQLYERERALVIQLSPALPKKA